MEKQAKLQEATCEQIAHTIHRRLPYGGMRTRVEGTLISVSLVGLGKSSQDVPEGWTAGQYLNDIAERFSQNLIMATYLHRFGFLSMRHSAFLPHDASALLLEPRLQLDSLRTALNELKRPPTRADARTTLASFGLLTKLHLLARVATINELLFSRSEEDRIAILSWHNMQLFQSQYGQARVVEEDNASDVNDHEPVDLTATACSTQDVMKRLVDSMNGDMARYWLSKVLGVGGFSDAKADQARAKLLELLLQMDDHELRAVVTRVFDAVGVPNEAEAVRADEAARVDAAGAAGADLSDLDRFVW